MRVGSISASSFRPSAMRAVYAAHARRMPRRRVVDSQTMDEAAVLNCSRFPNSGKTNTNLVRRIDRAQSRTRAVL
jgi:hypothetical protein